MTKKILNKLIVILLILIISISVLQSFSHASESDDMVQPVSETVGDSAGEGEAEENKKLMTVVREVVAQWYYVFRYFSIIAMLVILIYLGIQLAINSSATDKAQYKRMLMDWLVGFIIIFTIHYFMVLVLKINDVCLETIDKVSKEIVEDIAADHGGEISSQGLYETVRTRAYEFRIGIGTSGMIMYMVLVYYTIKFAIIYFKRFFTVMILTIMAPFVGLSYAFTKVMSGKAPIIKTWTQEYCFNVFLQTIHALIYTIFVSMALVLSVESVAGFIVAMLMLNFMTKADKIFRKVFKFSGKILGDNADKDIKENFAALTAIKASTAGVVGSQMAKDTAEVAKRGVGAVTNVGLRAGLMAYNQGLKNNNAKLYDMQQESQAAAVDLMDSKKSEEEKQKIENKKAKLDNKIAKMEARRSKMKGYTEGIENSSETGKYLSKQNDEKREKQIEAEYQRRLKVHKKLNLAPYEEEDKQKLRKQVEREINNQVKKRKVYKDERTGQKEVISGIANQMSAEFNRALWGNDAIKSATKAMIKGTGKKITGNAMIFAAIPLTVANPKVGLALLGKGINNTKSSNGLKKVTNFNQRRKLEKSKRAKLEQQKQERKTKKQEEKYENLDNKKYIFNRFDKNSLKTIQAKERMEKEADIIRKINMPTLKLGILTAPLRLMGLTGGIRSVQSYAYKVDKAKKKYYQNQEASYAVARKRSVNSDFITLYNNTVHRMESQYDGMDLENAIIENKKLAGNIYEVEGKKFEFKNTKLNSLTEEDLIDNAILNVAIRNNKTDLSELNLKDEEIQVQIIEELSAVGILSNFDKKIIEEPTNKYNKLIQKLDSRKESLNKEKPEALKEKLVQVVTKEYMIENKITNIEELAKPEHVKEIKEIINERLKQDTVEKVIEEKREEVVIKAIETTDDETQRQKIIEREARKLFLTEPSEEVKKILDKLQERKIELGVEDEKEIDINDVIISINVNERIEDLLTEESITKQELEQIIRQPDALQTKNNITEKIETILQEENITKEQLHEIINTSDEYEKVKEKVDIKVSTFMEEGNINNIIASINEKKQERTKTENFIEQIISNVGEVTSEATLTQDEQKYVTEIKVKQENAEKIEKSQTGDTDKKEKVDTHKAVDELIQKTKQRKVRASKEFIDLNEELRKFDSLKSIDEVTDEFVEKNISGKYDGLLTHLIETMNEDKVLVELKVKNENDERVKSMKYFDEQREKKTYNNNNIDEIISIISSRR